MDNDWLEMEAQERAVARGWRWKCCPHCPSDRAMNLHPDPDNQHLHPCDQHGQNAKHGRTRLKEDHCG